MTMMEAHQHLIDLLEKRLTPEELEEVLTALDDLEDAIREEYRYR